MLHKIKISCSTMYNITQLLQVFHFFFTTCHYASRQNYELWFHSEFAFSILDLHKSLTYAIIANNFFLIHSSQGLTHLALKSFFLLSFITNVGRSRTCIREINKKLQALEFLKRCKDRLLLWWLWNNCQLSLQHLNGFFLYKKKMYKLN